MRHSVVAKSLLILGAVVGAGAGLALALGVGLDQLPPWLITVGMYKLAFIAAAGLFAAGAVLGRAARRTPSHEETSHYPVPPRDAVGPGPWQPDHDAPRQADRARRERRDE